eukprot:scaffold5015_cov51-Attheya_sp.AAC.3
MPSENEGGLFGQLFGLTFENHPPSSDESVPTHLIRAISKSEYIATFGYDANFNYLVAADSDAIDSLRSAVPVRTMQAILRQADIYLREKLEALVVNQEDRFGVDLSVSAFMNGIVSDELPEDTAW